MPYFVFLSCFKKYFERNFNILKLISLSYSYFLPQARFFNWYLWYYFLLLHSFPSFVILLHSSFGSSVLFYCLTISICWIAFISAAIFFFDSNQMLSIFSDFWWGHNSVNIIWYNLYFVLPLKFLFLYVVLHLNQWAGHKISPHCNS